MISLDQKIAILDDSEIPIFFNVVILIFSFLIYLSNAMAIWSLSLIVSMNSEMQFCLYRPRTVIFKLLYLDSHPGMNKFIINVSDQRQKLLHRRLHELYRNLYYHSKQSVLDNWCIRKWKKYHVNVEVISWENSQSQQHYFRLAFLSASLLASEFFPVITKYTITTIIISLLKLGSWFYVLASLWSLM